MNEQYQAISELTFASFCSEITQQDETTLTFKIKHYFHDTLRAEVFVLRETEDGLFVSDKGNTLRNLDDIFNLDEPDVIKHIEMISEQFSICKTERILSRRVDPSKEVIPQIMRFLQGIHFMYTMKLFYK
jgi:hypothetical protein